MPQLLPSLSSSPFQSITLSLSMSLSTSLPLFQTLTAFVLYVYNFQFLFIYKEYRKIGRKAQIYFIDLIYLSNSFSSVRLHFANQNQLTNNNNKSLYHPIFYQINYIINVLNFFSNNVDRFLLFIQNKRTDVKKITYLTINVIKATNNIAFALICVEC